MILHYFSQPTGVRPLDNFRTDGPFGEAKEVVGGYWMVQVQSREEALEWAARCPAGERDTIEVRQIMEFSDSRPMCERRRSVQTRE